MEKQVGVEERGLPGRSHSLRKSTFRLHFLRLHPRPISHAFNHHGGARGEVGGGGARAGVTTYSTARPRQGALRSLSSNTVCISKAQFAGIMCEVPAAAEPD